MADDRTLEYAGCVHTLAPPTRLDIRRLEHHLRHDELFQLLLARSGGAVPLTLSVQVGDSDSPGESDAATKLVTGLVNPHTRRLKELKLSLPAALLDVLLVQPSGTLPFDHLEGVVLEYPVRGVAEGSPLRGVFRDAPRLKSFSICGKLPAYTLELPWMHTIGTADGSRRILQRSLTIQSNIDITICETALLPFLGRTPPLTHLTLIWWVPLDAMKALLRATPCITHLHFVPGKTIEVFKLLWSADLIPQLEGLTVVCYPNMWEEVVEILGLRGLTGRLREVHVSTFFRKNVDLWD
ncbi:hypothetical protein DXG03_003617 [Asterophora parasitica]|uniref:Uncharacterized protein n=1 Tax=Asterophora parasitica TaxID=117018 RepID=A0A9P7G4S6_9AGAR|nr:hypothetical protein DXG03_003617 [Asterophora parasitica]